MIIASRAFVIAGLLAAIGATAPAHAQVYFMAAGPADDDDCFLHSSAAPVYGVPAYAPQQFVLTDLLGLLGGINIRLDGAGNGSSGGGSAVDSEALRRANDTLNSCDRKLDKISELLTNRLNKYDSEIAELIQKQEQTTQALDQRITETTELVKGNAEQIKAVTGLIGGNAQRIEDLQVEVKILQPFEATHSVTATDAAVPRFKKSDGSEQDGEFEAGSEVDAEFVKEVGDYRLIKYEEDDTIRATFVKKDSLKKKD